MQEPITRAPGSMIVPHDTGAAEIMGSKPVQA